MFGPAALEATQDVDIYWLCNLLYTDAAERQSLPNPYQAPIKANQV